MGSCDRTQRPSSPPPDPCRPTLYHCQLHEPSSQGPLGHPRPPHLCRYGLLFFLYSVSFSSRERAKEKERQRESYLLLAPCLHSLSYRSPPGVRRFACTLFAGEVSRRVFSAFRVITPSRSEPVERHTLLSGVSAVVVFAPSEGVHEGKKDLPHLGPAWPGSERGHDQVPARLQGKAGTRVAGDACDREKLGSALLRPCCTAADWACREAAVIARVRLEGVATSV